MKKETRNPNGFTLIEVIIAIVLVAILGTVLVSYMSGGISKSGLPVVWVKQEFDIYKTMEKITADYQKALLSSPFDLHAFQTDKVTPYASGNMTVTTDYLNINRTSGAQATADYTSGLILRVTLQKGDQSVTALFTR